MELVVHLPWSDVLNMSHDISKKAPKDPSNNIPHEPSSVSKWLLRSLVPHSDNDSKSGSNSALECTEEDSVCEQASCVETQGCEHQDSAPDKPVVVSQVAVH